MLASTWQALCTAMQRREAVGANRQNGMTPEDFAAISAARFPCAVCAGQSLPPGLELITQEEVSEMARNTKRGVCELCGAHANIGMNHGSAVCPKCTHIQSAINQRIDVVAKAARAMHKTEDLLGHLIPAGELAVQVTATLLQEISGIVGYDGENPAELVAAVRGAIATKKATALDCGDCDLAGCFNELAELVDQRGVSAGQVVEAVRRRALACVSCDAEDVLHEIREIVGYTPEQGDKGLADAVRWLQAKASSAMDCAECDAAEAMLEIAELVGKRGASSGLVVEAVRESVETAATLSATGDFLRDDLMRACGMDKTQRDLTTEWPLVSLAAIQTIAEWINRQYDMSAIILRYLETISNLRNEIALLNGQTHSESEQVSALRDDLDRSTGVIEQLRAELTLIEQAHDEWEQRAVQAEMNVETLEAEVKEADARNGRLQYQLAGYAPEPCPSTTYLLDIALKALRGEGPDADQLAVLIDAARRAA
jgi:hypothetical protein